MSNGSGLASVNNIVLLMLENRSFDHMLGFLYSGQGNISPAGQPFDGLTGTESNPDATGAAVTVSRIEPTTPNAYFMPGADPGEGYMATNDQLFGTEQPRRQPVAGARRCRASSRTSPTRSAGRRKTSGWSIETGTTASDIMGCFTPEALPVLSALARGYAVCDQWFASVPTETLPNRAFASAATSQGHMDDKTRTFTSPSIFGLLGQHDVSWGIYGYDAEPLTKSTFTDIAGAASGTSASSPASRPRPRSGHAAGVHVPGAELGLGGQQPAPELRRGARRAAHPRRLRGAPRRARLAADAADRHL